MFRLLMLVHNFTTPSNVPVIFSMVFCSLYGQLHSITEKINYYSCMRKMFLCGVRLHLRLAIGRFLYFGLISQCHFHQSAQPVGTSNYFLKCIILSPLQKHLSHTRIEKVKNLLSIRSCCWRPTCRQHVPLPDMSFYFRVLKVIKWDMLSLIKDTIKLTKNS